jgi:inorganic pyrophosphatase
MFPAPPPRLQRLHTSTGQDVTISRADLQQIRAIFDLFDVDRSGNITAPELQQVHARLGEPITEEEAREAIVAMIGQSYSPRPDVAGGRSGVTFDEFLVYWNRDSKYVRVRARVRGGQRVRWDCV